MKELNASPGKLISIGYEGEDNVTKIVFRYDEEWLACGNGVFKIRVLRHGDTEAYNATEVIDDRTAMTLTMTVTDIELSVKGHGEMQVVYIGSDFVKKSPVYRYNVSRAIDSEIVNPPQGSIINELAQSVGDLTELTTTDKSSLVSAINEVNAKEVEVTVDSELSAVSANPLQNKIVTLSFMNALDRLEQDESQISELQSDVGDVQTALAGKASTDTATQSTNGLMSSADKTKLDGLGDSGVSDVQVNGTSIVSDGVAEIPIAGSFNFGAVKVDSYYGISMVSIGTRLGTIQFVNPTNTQLKAGENNNVRPSVAQQHISTFYGLAKASGDTTQSASSNAVGTYTEEAKSKISDMLNGAVSVSGTTPTITALSGVRYVCGEVSTLDITPCVSGICDVIFTSGSTATVLTLPSTVKFPDGAFTPEANTTYELNIMDGIYGVVMAWT